MIKSKRKTISNENGFQADVMNYGAILVNLFVPNNRGKVADVTLGYDHLKKYSYNGKIYYSNDILHIPSRFGYDGKIGHSIFVEANKAFDTASSLETYTDNTFNNNLGKRLIIDIEKAYPNLRRSDRNAVRQLFYT